MDNYTGNELQQRVAGAIYGRNTVEMRKGAPLEPKKKLHTNQCHLQFTSHEIIGVSLSVSQEGQLGCFFLMMEIVYVLFVKGFSRTLYKVCG